MQRNLIALTRLGDPLAATFYAEADEATAILLFARSYGLHDLLLSTCDSFGDVQRLIPRKIIKKHAIKKIMNLRS